MRVKPNHSLVTTGRRWRHLAVVERFIADLTPHPANPRTHTKKQLRQILASIEQFDWTNPVLIDQQKRIIAGLGRVEAAALGGETVVPTICIEDLTEEEILAYIIADNRLAELADWDQEILAIDFQYLAGLDLDFDLEITGFETADIDLLIESLDTGEDGDGADWVPQRDDSRPPVSRLPQIPLDWESQRQLLGFTRP